MSRCPIDVLMPVHNAGVYLRTAVESILDQTFGDFRLICVDDGSTDESPQILRKLAGRDDRVTVLSQANVGVVGALNAGLAICTAPLIARMDADDIAMPQRLERQQALMDEQPAVVAVGSAVLEIDGDGAPLGVQSFETDPLKLDAGMLRLKTGMAHPSVMMRREAVESVGAYRPQYRWGQDLDLWLRLAETGRLTNLPDVLLCYRQHVRSVTWQAGKARGECLQRLLREAYQRRGLEMPADLAQRCTRQRSAAGPTKWARKAARSGQTSIAIKHMGRQWRDAPMSLLTWRMSLEVALRCIARRLWGQPGTLPAVPLLTPTS